jgi:hypothetical protein
VPITLRTDDLRGPEIATLLQVHLDAMYAYSPPESVHVFDPDAFSHFMTREIRQRNRAYEKSDGNA